VVRVRIAIVPNGIYRPGAKISIHVWAYQRWDATSLEGILSNDCAILRALLVELNQGRFQAVYVAAVRLVTNCAFHDVPTIVAAYLDQIDLFLLAAA
jgi:hypothetical protein